MSRAKRHRGAGKSRGGPAPTSRHSSMEEKSKEISSEEHSNNHEATEELTQSPTSPDRTTARPTTTEVTTGVPPDPAFIAQNQSLNTGAIVGGTVALLLVVSVVLGLFIFWKKRSKKPTPVNAYQNGEYMTNDIIKPEYQMPNNIGTDETRLKPESSTYEQIQPVYAVPQKLEVNQDLFTVDNFMYRHGDSVQK
ncbi:hypothetical protein CAPTEDRAFT_205838 [Capitella teleta]|uniref:Uncharacterized protein n=1 Tax=Capitella teleta TaxID=283909 RepID=R7TBG6_CAPTE|nr:hypothetical protein CAPTEDRAFT_205838 [Capitella teleta]|eukprot:ELT91064.1 hypothetical protein CAPTEDRAFT_205838 [Capitella teleta]